MGWALWDSILDWMSGWLRVIYYALKKRYVKKMFKKNARWSVISNFMDFIKNFILPSTEENFISVVYCRMQFVCLVESWRGSHR